MSTSGLEKENNSDDMLSLEQLRRKRDQAWELAGLARQDGDTADERRWTNRARELQRKIRECV